MSWAPKTGRGRQSPHPSPLGPGPGPGPGRPRTPSETPPCSVGPQAPAVVPEAQTAREVHNADAATAVTVQVVNVTFSAACASGFQRPQWSPTTHQEPFMGRLV